MLTTSLLLATLPNLVEPNFQSSPQQTEAPSAFSYSFVQAGFTRTDIDGFDDEADGLSFQVSHSVAPQVFLFGGVGFSAVGVYIVDLGSGQIIGEDDLETTTISGGVGFHHPVGPQTDFVADLAIASVDIDVDAIGFSDSTTIWAVEAGIRHLLDPKVEVNAAASLQDGSEIDSQFGAALGARFYATPKVSIGAGLGVFDDSTSIGLSVRFQW